MKLRKEMGLIMAERKIDPKVLQRRINRVLKALFIAGTIFFILVPILLLFKISVSAPQDILTQHPPFLIKNFTLESLEKGFGGRTHLGSPLEKCGRGDQRCPSRHRRSPPRCLCHFATAHRDKIWGSPGDLSTRMFPEVGIALPISVTFIRWGLVDTNFGLVLAHQIKVLPLMAWILTGTFDSIPKDLEQSALVDGCDKLQALVIVVLPLSLAGMAAASILCWLESWNEFTYAVYLCLADATLPLKTYYYVRRGNWFESAAYAVFLTIPVLIITFALQNYLKSDYLSGALKY